MRKFIFPTIIIFSFCLLFFSCKSKEDKANELIRQHLAKTLCDFESYEPVETIVTEAYQTPENDTSSITLGYIIVGFMEQIKEYGEKMENAKEKMDLWGAPTYYSSSYSDNKYYKYQNEARDYLDKGMTTFAMFSGAGLCLEDTIAKLDPKKQIGWIAEHTYRCKSIGGIPLINHERFIISNNFDKIIWSDDLDGEKYDLLKEIINLAKKKTFSSIRSNNN